MTGSEKQTLNAYISSDSYKINDKLRRGAALTEKERQLIENLDRALDKMPVYEGVAYRSVSDFGIDDIEAFFAEYVPGKRLSFPAYTSSGTRIYDESFPIQYVIQSRTGRDIRSFNREEYEILFPRNTSFQVVRRKGNTIFLEEI